MPVGAFGGKREIMEHLAPSGPVYQAGTLSGNPIAMSAGLAALNAIQAPGMYDTLSANTEKLALGIQAQAHELSIPMTVNYAGSMFGLFFTDVEKVVNYQQAINCNTEQFNRFYHKMLELGVYMAPASYEAGFVSVMHSEAIIDQTIQVARAALQSLKA